MKSICVFHKYRGYFISDCSTDTARKLKNILYRSSLFPVDRPDEQIEVSKQSIQTAENITLQIGDLHVALEMVGVSTQKFNK